MYINVDLQIKNHILQPFFKGLVYGNTEVHEKHPNLYVVSYFNV